MGGVLGQLESCNGLWNAKYRWLRKMPKFQIRRVHDGYWLLVRPDGWAAYYYDFDGCIKWLDYSIARYMRRMT